MLDFTNLNGPSLVVGLLVLGAVIALGGIAFAFQGSIQF